MGVDTCNTLTYEGICVHIEHHLHTLHPGYCQVTVKKEPPNRRFSLLLDVTILMVLSLHRLLMIAFLSQSVGALLKMFSLNDISILIVGASEPVLYFRIS